MQLKLGDGKGVGISQGKGEGEGKAQGKYLGWRHEFRSLLHI